MNAKKLILTLFIFAISTVTIFGTSTITTWVKDMYNQPSVKPQEASGITDFPIDVVSAGDKSFNTVPKPFGPEPIDFSVYHPPKNKIEGYSFALDEGKRLFLTYCAVCHGADGKLNGGKGTKISLKGMKILPINIFPAGYYVERMRRGGVQMPPMAYRMNPDERWHIAHYIHDYLFK